MVVITVEAYKDAEVHTITVKKKDYFWVKMKDVQDKLGLKNRSDLSRKEMCDRFENNYFTEKQKRKRYLRSEYQITKVERDNKKDKSAKNNIIEKIIKIAEELKSVKMV